MKKLSVQTGCDEVIGVSLEIYIPEEKVAIETCNGTERIESLKEHLCKKRNIRLLKVPYKVGDNEVEFAGKIKKAFCSIHIFITSDETKDAEFIRKRFFEWRRK